LESINIVDVITESFIFYMYVIIYVCFNAERELNTASLNMAEVTNRKVLISVVTHAQTRTQDV